jgi:hypothetical protein
MKPLYLPFLLLLVVGLIPAKADDKPTQPDKPAPKLPLGKETTYVTGPLDKAGYIDYEAALNAELGRGITADKNANALLITVFGPAPEGGSGLPPEYFRWLDIPIPEKDGEYFFGLGTYARQRLALTNMQLEALYEQQSRATSRPWSAKDFTVIAEWLKANEKQLAVVSEAMKRTEYFNPLCSHRKEGEGSNLIASLLPTVQKCRELASALSSRAMLRVHDGKFDDAWQDILTCQRLGRLTSRGSTLIESLVGIAICQIANNTTLAYIEQAKLTSKQVAERLKDLQKLPPLAAYADKLDIGERFMGLDALQNIRRFGGGGELGIDVFALGRGLTEEEVKALDKLDWAVVMQTMNKWYDRMAAALRVKERAAREKEIDKLDADTLAQAKKAEDGANFAKLLLAKDGPDKVVAERLGNALLSLLTPAVRKVLTAYERAEQTERNLHVAFAMAAYNADHGRYPSKLDDLAPDYLTAIPGDLFSGKALIYKPNEKGYLFYSVGPNGKDDGGRWYDDDPPGDDPSVRMPLPPLKKK